MKKGNKQNAILNREYAHHLKPDGKSYTASKRRNIDKKIILKEIKES